MATTNNSTAATTPAPTAKKLSYTWKIFILVCGLLFFCLCMALDGMNTGDNNLIVKPFSHDTTPNIVVKEKPVKQKKVETSSSTSQSSGYSFTVDCTGNSLTILVSNAGDAKQVKVVYSASQGSCEVVVINKGSAKMALDTGVLFSDFTSVLDGMMRLAYGKAARGNVMLEKRLKDTLRLMHQEPKNNWDSIPRLLYK